MNKRKQGRSLRFREFSLPDIIEFAARRKTVEHPLPESPRILRGALKAVLWRLEDMKPKEAGFVQMHLRHLTFLESVALQEQLSKSDQANFANRITFHLDAIANAPMRGKLKHDIAAIDKQANWLTNYLRANPLLRLNKLRYRAHWNEWLRQRIPIMVDLIIVFPCSCRYPKPIDFVVGRIITEALGEIQCTPAQLIRLVLAALHESTPAGIDQYLKKSARNNSGL